jgi:hypothetical protein
VLSADNRLREQQRCFLVTFCHPTKSYPLLKAAEALKYSTKTQAQAIKNLKTPHTDTRAVWRKSVIARRFDFLG